MVELGEEVGREAGFVGTDPLRLTVSFDGDFGGYDADDMLMEGEQDGARLHNARTRQCHYLFITLALARGRREGSKSMQPLISNATLRPPMSLLTSRSRRFRCLLRAPHLRVHNFCLWSGLYRGTRTHADGGVTEGRAVRGLPVPFGT